MPQIVAQGAEKERLEKTEICCGLQPWGKGDARRARWTQENCSRTNITGQQRAMLDVLQQLLANSNRGSASAWPQGSGAATGIIIVLRLHRRPAFRLQQVLHRDTAVTRLFRLSDELMPPMPRAGKEKWTTRPLEVPGFRQYCDGYAFLTRPIMMRRRKCASVTRPFTSPT